MQVKDKSTIQRRILEAIGVLLKVSVTLVCLYFLTQQFQDQEINFSQIIWPKNVGWFVSIVSALTLVNWYLEALRWQVSVASFESISIQKALGAVLGGLALNWILPFTSGDLASRVVSLRDKYQAVSALLLNRSIMLILTVAFGGYSLNYSSQTLIDVKWIFPAILMIGVLLSILFSKRISRFLRYFKSINRHHLIKLILISVFRYTLFTFQFYLLLKVFNPEISTSMLLAGIGWIFLARSIIPHILGGVGLREAASILFFSTIVDDMSFIIIPVFLIWIVNTVIPSIAGLIFVWKFSLLKLK